MSVKEKHTFVKLEDDRFEEILSVTEASNFSGLTRQTLYSWMKRGFIEYVTISSQGDYILKNSLIKYIK